MKAISLKQPWANMIARGEKTIETRTWTTRYRGPLLIVSSMKPNIPPVGCIVALATLVDCRPMVAADQEDACCEIYPRAVAWILDRVRTVAPVRVKGQLGIYDLPYTERDLHLSMPPIVKLLT